MKTLITISIFFSITLTFGQNMTITKLGEIFESSSDSIIVNKSRWSFMIREIPFVAIADSTYNRMRIMSPIIEIERLSEELKTASLMANFHTALDIKYAISDDILWSVFIHPLKELSEDQVLDAISQVFYGNVNFGTTFSSTSLVFPGNARKKPEKKKHEQVIPQKI